MGTRASANTSGPDFTSSFENPLGVLEPVKLRTAGIHTERRKPGFFCRTGFRASELFRNNDPAVDLMSRRPPLSSTRADPSKPAFGKQTLRKARVTCRHQAAGNFCKR